MSPGAAAISWRFASLRSKAHIQNLCSSGSGRHWRNSQQELKGLQLDLWPNQWINALAKHPLRSCRVDKWKLHRPPGSCLPCQRHSASLTVVYRHTGPTGPPSRGPEGCNLVTPSIPCLLCPLCDRHTNIHQATKHVPTPSWPEPDRDTSWRPEIPGPD